MPISNSKKQGLTPSAGSSAGFKTLQLWKSKAYDPMMDTWLTDPDKPISASGKKTIDEISQTFQQAVK